jgi:hypothetical protein
MWAYDRRRPGRPSRCRPELVHERLCALVAMGRVSFGVAMAGYNGLMKLARGEEQAR